MKKPALLDIYIVALFLLLIGAYYSLFGTSGVLFYLISTPPQFILWPILVIATYRFLRKEHYQSYVAVFCLFFIYTFVISGRFPIPSTLYPMASTQNTSVRICSWNSAFFFENSKDIGFSTLAQRKCDFIVIQEVWKSSEFQTEIKKWRDFYLPNYDYRFDKEYVIFVPPGSDVDMLKSDSGVFYGVDIAYKNKLFTLLSIHLWNPISDRPELVNGEIKTIPAFQAREEQGSELLSKLKELTNNPLKSVIIVGDFNTMQNDKILRDIGRIGKGDYRMTPINVSIFQKRETYSASRRIIEIDHSFVSRGIYANSKLKLECNPKASDHCLLIIDLLL